MKSSSSSPRALGNIWRVSWRIVLYTILTVLLYVSGVLAFGTFRDWQPPAQKMLPATATAPVTEITDSVISLTTWNIGYTGLGSESNFFYDSPSGFYYSGGKMVRPTADLSDKNLNGAELLVKSTQSDFFLLQEVDLSSKRSYYANAFDSLRLQQPDYAAFFATNYKNDRVPIPLLQPWSAYGAVHSGLATLSKYQPYFSERLQLPGSFSWPNRVFQLDRCVSIHKYRTNRIGDLIVMNIHLSAYDANGALKKTQMDFLRDLALAEYEKGNYVIIGGDWNLCPPNFAYDTFTPGKTQGHSQINIADDFYPLGWQWIYDPTIPTNRKMREVYVKGETFITIIDYYLISPNLQANKVKTIDQDFRFSDHQPVWVELGFMD